MLLNCRDEIRKLFDGRKFAFSIIVHADTTGPLINFHQVKVCMYGCGCAGVPVCALSCKVLVPSNTPIAHKHEQVALKTLAGAGGLERGVAPLTEIDELVQTLCPS